MNDDDRKTLRTSDNNNLDTESWYQRAVSVSWCPDSSQLFSHHHCHNIWVDTGQWSDLTRDQDGQEMSSVSASDVCIIRVLAQWHVKIFFSPPWRQYLSGIPSLESATRTQDWILWDMFNCYNVVKNIFQILLLNTLLWRQAQIMEIIQFNSYWCAYRILWRQTQIICRSTLPVKKTVLASSIKWIWFHIHQVVLSCVCLESVIKEWTARLCL